jgi:FMN reductase (NADPH)/FMN reductase [NAD(P)H]
MNQVMEVLLNRKSVRAYEDRPVPEEARAAILRAAMRAPTAGNMMLYSIIHVRDQGAKETLARTCDNQPFIARAPLVLLFLADYQRWLDYFIVSGVEQLCEQSGEALRKPGAGDLLLACCDALIAAHTAVIAAESLGIGSCYIGDIMENCEAHQELFGLPRYAFPICLLCFGYPTAQQKQRPQMTRFRDDFIVFENRYKRLSAGEFEEMYRQKRERMATDEVDPGVLANVGQLTYSSKYNAGFAKELNRSVRVMLRAWTGE